MVTEPFHPGGPPGLSPGGPPRGPVPGPRRSGRGRRTLIAGLVITVVSLIVAVTSTVIVVSAMGHPLYETITNEARLTPVDAKLTLRAGRTVVYELTERESTSAPAVEKDTTIKPKDVKVTGPDGASIPTTGFESSSETLSRSDGVYAGVVRFVTPKDGVYRVRVTTKDTQVVIAPALGSGFRKVLVWLTAGVLSALTFVLGVIVLIVGAVRRRRAPSTAPAGGTGVPAKGWYPAPDADGKQRYWDGQAWTQYLR